MTREGKLAVILCGLLGGLCAAGPNCASAQAPQEQAAPVYPQTKDGLKDQMATAVEAYRRGDAVAGRRLLEQFRMPQSDQWFAANFGPERGATLAKRYDRIFEKYLQSTEKTLQDIGGAKGRKLQTNLEPCRRDPPQARGSERPSGLVPLKEPICFNGFFSTVIKNNARLLGGDFKALSWEDTVIYQDGAFRFMGRGGWPFWEWEQPEEKTPTSP